MNDNEGKSFIENTNLNGVSANKTTYQLLNGQRSIPLSNDDALFFLNNTVSRYNKTLTQLWSKTITMPAGLTTSFFHVDEMKNGDFLHFASEQSNLCNFSSCRRLVTTRLSSTGAVLWQRSDTIGLPDNIAFSMVMHSTPTKDNGCIVTFSNVNGNVVAYKFGATNTKTAFSVAGCVDLGFNAARLKEIGTGGGFYQSVSLETFCEYGLGKLNAAGQLIWSKKINPLLVPPPGSINNGPVIPTPDGGVLMISNDHLLRFDAAGNLTFDKTLTMPGGMPFLFDGVLTTGGDYYFGGIDAANNKFILLKITAADLSPVVDTCTGNLLQNPRFENNLANWDGLGEAVTTGANSGTKALKVCQSGQAVRQTLSTSAGKTYTMRGFAKKDAGATMLVSMKFLNGSFIPLVFEYSNSAVSNTWSALTPVVMTAPTGAAWVEISVLHNGGTGCVYADDLCLVEGGSGNPCNPDITAPTFQNCPPNISLSTTGTSAIATWAAPTVIDVCTGQVNVNSNYVPGNSFPIGTRTVIYTASDNANNTSSCNFTVNVSNGTGGPCANDVVPPVFTFCPPNFSLETTGTTAFASWPPPQVTDNCTAFPTLVGSIPGNSALPIGVTIVRYNATDEANNTATCTFTVTVRAQNGFFSCPGNQLTNDGFEQGSISPFSGGAASLESNAPITGIYSMRIANTNTLAPIIAAINFAPGTKLSNLTFKHMEFAASNTQIRVQVLYYSQPSSIQVGTDEFLLNRSVGQVKTENLTLTGGTNAGFAAIRFYNDDTGAMLLDDICITGTILPPTSCAENILSDPGFEAGGNGWQPGTALSIVNNAASGTKALAICTNSSGPFAFQTKAMTAGRNMTFQFQAKHDGTPAKVLAYIKYMNASFVPLVQEFFTYNCTGTFASVLFSKISPPNTVWVEVGFRNDAGGCVIVDDVCFGDGTGTGTNCTLVATESNKVCNNNGTPDNATDDTFTFSATVTNTGNCGTGWTGGSSPNLSGNYGTSYTFGPYSVFVVAASLTFTAANDPTLTQTLNVAPPPSCSNGSNGIPNCGAASDFPWEDWIGAVKVKTTEKTSGKSQYSNFASTVFNLSKSAANSIVLTSGYSYFTYDEYWRVWIDYNHDNIFQAATEKAFEGILTKPANGTANKILTGSITVPAAALAGNAKMRVVMRRGAYGAACGNIPFGEVEDYTVNITQALQAGASRADQIGLQDLFGLGQGGQDGQNQTGLEDLSGFRLFPNPAGESVNVLLRQGHPNVTATSSSRITILNQLGKPVFEKTFDISMQVEDVLQLDLSNISNGLYFVKMETAGQRAVVKRLVVSRMY